MLPLNLPSTPQGAGFVVGVALWPGGTLDDWKLSFNTTDGANEPGLSPCRNLTVNGTVVSGRDVLVRTDAHPHQAPTCIGTHPPPRQHAASFLPRTPSSLTPLHRFRSFGTTSSAHGQPSPKTATECSALSFFEMHGALSLSTFALKTPPSPRATGPPRCSASSPASV